MFEAVPKTLYIDYTIGSGEALFFIPTDSFTTNIEDCGSAILLPSQDSLELSLPYVQAEFGLCSGETAESSVADLTTSDTTTDTTKDVPIPVIDVKSDARMLASSVKEDSISSMCYNDETQEITINVSDTAMADTI